MDSFIYRFDYAASHCDCISFETFWNIGQQGHLKYMSSSPQRLCIILRCDNAFTLNNAYSRNVSHLSWFAVLKSLHVLDIRLFATCRHYFISKYLYFTPHWIFHDNFMRIKVCVVSKLCQYQLWSHNLHNDY